MRETRVEAHLRAAVTGLGGLCFKLAPTTAGLPDRLVVWPDGRVRLVEVKAPGGRLRPIQRVMHDRLAERSVDVAVLSSVEDVDEWVLLSYGSRL